jgi:tRNA(fMet)-specific endonuclease VapC
LNYLLDTNVISELVARQPNPRVLQWLDGLDPGGVYLSVITIGELRKGIEKLPPSTRREALERWLNDDLLLRFSDRILNLDVGAMLTWGVLMGRLEAAGTPLPAIDSLIAALALHHGCSLVTRNDGDFQRAGIAVINPWHGGKAPDWQG